MSDFQPFARIPYGYKIIDGKAIIDQPAAEKLLTYFSEYLAGATMAEAARKAQLNCSASTYHRLFARKEYSGTDYYPAIISPTYQARLIAEYERRKGERPCGVVTHPPKGVPLYTKFKVFKMQTTAPTDAAAVYQRIRPQY